VGCSWLYTKQSLAGFRIVQYDYICSKSRCIWNKLKVNNGIETLIATFVMGLVWGIVYLKLEVYDGQSPGD
jgi:hypothetical protein